MVIEERTEGDVSVLELDGKFLGGPETMDMHFRVKELIEQGHTKIVFDMSQTKLLNSTALGVLVSSLTSLRHADGDLKLCCLNSRLQALLKVTDVRTILEEYDSVGEAIASFGM